MKFRTVPPPLLSGADITAAEQTMSLAALPLLYIPANTNQGVRDRFDLAWKEGIQLARAIAVNFQGACDPVYQRYFDPAGASFVKHVFREYFPECIGYPAHTGSGFHDEASKC